MTYTSQVVSALRMWEPSDPREPCGNVALDVRDGPGHHHAVHVLTVPSPAYGLPMSLTTMLLENLTVRLSPFTCDQVAQPLGWPFLFVIWRPEWAIDAERRKAVTAAGRARVAAALETLPLPNLLIDAGPEVLAAWKLDRPIISQAETSRRLIALATRAGADTTGLERPDALTLPFAGPIRNWNSLHREYAAIVVADPTRTYTLDAFTPSETTSHASDRRPSNPHQRRRRQAPGVS